MSTSIAGGIGRQPQWLFDRHRACGQHARFNLSAAGNAFYGFDVLTVAAREFGDFGNMAGVDLPGDERNDVFAPATLIDPLCVFAGVHGR